jgi:hypothetical protein
MGRILLFVGLLLGGAGATVAQSSDDYSKDAIQLAARVAAGLGESSEISGNLIAELSLALDAVNQSTEPNAMLVTKKFNIHSFSFASTNAVELYVDASAEWAKNLQNGEIDIVETPLRRYAALYDLKIVKAKRSNNILILSLESSQIQNMKFIGNELSLADDVMMVELPAQTGIGNDIKAKRVNGGWMLTYILSYEDCKTGCYKQCEWQFGVTADGESSFMGTYGQLPNSGDNALVKIEDWIGDFSNQ